MIHVLVEVVRNIKIVVEEKFKKVPIWHFFKAITYLNSENLLICDYVAVISTKMSNKAK